MGVPDKKILYLFDETDWKSRMPVAQLAKENGFDVTIALIGPGQEKAPEDYRTIHIKASAARLGLRGLLAMKNNIRRVIAAENPALIHTVTLKYAFISGLAALPFKNIQKIYTLAGLGYLFRSHGVRPGTLRILLAPLLKRILRNPSTHLIFQNPDDLALMQRLGYADPARAALIRGSGVDLAKFTAVPETESDAPLVLMPTRLVREKGIHIFVEAARILKARGMNARFQIAGGETRHNPKAISAEEMKSLTKDGVVKWLGRVEDMPTLLQSAAIIVYPSYYGEGIPRVLLEACAAGRPIITTNHPGCREAVKDGENGLLVPVRDSQKTAEAIEELLRAPEQRKAMGINSRKRAEQEFDVAKVAQETLSVYIKTYEKR